MLHQPVAETSKTLAPAPETRARADKRNHILEAAIRVFARTGYHSARVSDIASEAAVAYGLVYHYFRNKEEILDTIFEERWGGFLEAVQEIAERPGPSAEKLAAIAALILGAYRLRPAWVKVLVLEIQRSARFREPGPLRALGGLFRALAEIVRGGQETGELRSDLDPEIACLVFLGGLELAITALVLDVIELGEGERGEDAYCCRVADTVVEVFLRGLAAGEGRR